MIFLQLQSKRRIDPYQILLEHMLDLKHHVSHHFICPTERLNQSMLMANLDKYFPG